MRFQLWSALAASALCAGCTTYHNADSTIIPNAAINVSRSLSVPLESIAAGALLFVVIDPLAPNWQIEQSQIDADRFRIAMRKKRFTTGGDGEAGQIFLRRAGQLTREAGAVSYRVIEFSEGVESSVPVAQRVAHGVVEVSR